MNNNKDFLQYNELKVIKYFICLKIFKSQVLLIPKPLPWKTENLEERSSIFQIRRLLTVLIVVCSFAKCNKFVFLNKKYHLVSFILLQVG